MAIGIPPLPRPASGAPADMLLWAAQMTDALNAAFAALGAPVALYEVTDLAAPVRSLDCSGAATAAEVAEVLGSVIEDLKAAGQLA